LNPAAEKLIGYTLEEARGRRLDEVVRIVDTMGSNIAEIPVKQALDEDRIVGIDRGQRLRGRDGADVPVDLSAAPLRAEDGRRVGAVLVLRDVRSRRHHEQQLRASAQGFHSTFDFAPLGMALVGMDGRFMQVNEAICRFLGYESRDLLATSDDALTSPADRGLGHACFRDLLSGKTPVAQFEKRYLHRDGSRVLWALVNVSLIQEDEEPLCYLYQIHDLTAHKETELELSRLAYFDPLSGLANRSRLRDQMESMIANARRQRTQLAVVFMDLDRFKEINENLGQEAGDWLLKQVASRLTTVLRETDCAARLGGNEFVLLLSEVRAKESALIAVEKIRATVSQPIEIASQTFVAKPNFGISLYPTDAENSQDLLRCAESALYAAKADGMRPIELLSIAPSGRAG
jgi:diguanylate cyclase (GGDEF)-like protein/PAS domain S-box-containing protein